MGAEPNHTYFMRRCLELAKQGMPHVAPNPMVGAVLVHEGRIIGEGFHERFGGAHAEVNAIRSVHDKALLSKSTLYVNLEPCCHFGKTPPCTDLILESKIPRVVIGSLDPFPQVSGAGLAILKQSGVEITKGVLEDECRDVNKRFFTFHQKKRPYLVLKWAQTSDGFIAKGDFSSRWISSAASLALAHIFRSEECSVMVGTNTALYDDPELTVRLVPGRNPLRLVLDRTLRLPPTLKLFNGKARTVVFTEKSSGPLYPNVEYVQVKFWDALIPQLLDTMYQMKILSCLVEGGAKLVSSFISANAWDEARVFISPQKFGGGIEAPRILRPCDLARQINGDRLETFYNKKRQA